MTELSSPGSVFGDSTKLKFSGSSFNKREFIMIASGLVALVMCLVFVGLYGASVHSNSVGGSAAQSGGKPTLPTAPPYFNKGICKSQICLETTASVASFMNRSVNPCNDFHSYACGIWPKRNPIVDGFVGNTPITVVYNKNKEKLRKLMEATVTDKDTDSEVKLKHLFMSCLDDYGKMVKGANPFLQKVLHPISEGGAGGWYVFDNMDSNWNFQTALQRTHVDFWTDALFGFYVGVDWKDRKNRVIVISSAGLTMWRYWYYSTWRRAVQIRDDYKKLMRNVANLLARDYKLNVGEDVKNQRIETFVNDVMDFETNLANISRTSPYNPDRYNDEERVTLSTLNTQTHSVINWVQFFQYMFQGANVGSNTKVVITQENYIIKMADYVNNLGENKTRILNNYLVWKLAYAYLQDLSWEYVHANRQFYVDRTGRAQFLGTWRYCFNYVQQSMDTALSHLYVEDHFADDNKDKVEEIAKYVKQSLVDHLTDFKWMDASTRAYAKTKVQAIVDKLGYPQFILDASQVDNIYSTLQINESDYFQNVLNINKLDRVDATNRLKNGEDRSKWTGNTYSTFAQFYYPWNELLVPAGILQWPIYDYHIPHFLNFGSMGSIISHMYVHSIDYTGALYALNGTLLRDNEGKYLRWWNNETINGYNTARKCFVDYYTNKTLGPYTINGRKRTILVKGDSFASDGAVEVGGLKQAYNGYKKWETDNKGEPMAPGLGLTNDQMFFLSYAQTWCFVRNDLSAYQQASRGRIPENLKVNTAVSQMKEFSDAFNCPVNSPMNPQNKCSIW